MYKWVMINYVCMGFRIFILNRDVCKFVFYSKVGVS